jgi:excisionase family DNA binding protein
MPQGSDITIAGLIKRIPLDQVPSAIALLAARLLTENYAPLRQGYGGATTQEPMKLLTAGELAKHLNLRETWVRDAERLGRIPGVRLGKYVRFRLDEVEKALAERERIGPKSRSI